LIFPGNVLMTGNWQVGCPGVGPSLPHRYQSLRFLEWQWPQQHPVDHAENRGVGADAERQCYHRDKSKPGSFDQVSDPEANVFKQAIHWLTSFGLWSLCLVLRPSSFGYWCASI